MKLEALEARKIIMMVMGDKRALSKTDAELGLILKKRLTKKECAILNAEATKSDKNALMIDLKVDEARYEALKASAIKKMKNESVHGDFYYTKGE